jgi:serine/threonine protein kinase
LPGTFAGTPEYASPEQFAGIGVTARSDLYSLGVTLWAMLSGRAPFHGSVAELMQQHQHTPLPLEQIKHLPQPFLVLFQILLEKDPARRFESSDALVQAIPTLRRALAVGAALNRSELVETPAEGAVHSRITYALGKLVRTATKSRTRLVLSLIVALLVQYFSDSYSR